MERIITRTREIGVPGRSVITFRNRSLRLWKRFTLLHANPDGSPVLRGEVTWRDIVGFAINSHRLNFYILVQFRRWGP